MGIGNRDPKVTCLSDFPTFQLRRTSERQGVIFMSKFNQMPQHPHFEIEDYLGKKANHLTVIGIAERLPEDRWWYLKCRCDCGNETRITPSQFNRKVVKSCGCLKRTLHGSYDGCTKHPLYGAWKNMLNRCENPDNRNYHHYGGRGITVCDEWHEFSNFIKWSDSVGGKPNGYSLDRIDNNGNYCPENCRWANTKTQSNNKRDNVVLTFNGQSKTLSEWSEITGIKRGVLQHRYQRGWSTSDILTTPVNGKRNHN